MGLAAENGPLRAAKPGVSSVRYPCCAVEARIACRIAECRWQESAL